jgi:hypothetical protein
VIGQSLFAGVKRGSGALGFVALVLKVHHFGAGITVDSNFDDAPHSILLLLKIATGER